jgi:hypothetical protein
MSKKQESLSELAFNTIKKDVSLYDKWCNARTPKEREELMLKVIYDIAYDRGYKRGVDDERFWST